ncbi:hypothetical protein [Microvirga sp. G4-2]|uniref:hypothetical protein n=1 Tax=Microvirga sp. G4-2 TaxID=3434467 RepID=UPI00404487A7
MTYAAITSAKQLDWKATVWAGLIAGAVFMMMEMILMALAGMGFWGPPRMIAAIALGPGVLPPPATFDIGVIMVAMIIHIVLSIVYAFILTAIISAWNLTTVAAVVAGAVFGFILYVVNFYGFTAVFPWFAEARGWIGTVSHIAFGVVLAWTYRALASTPAALIP